jgi:release factor glutamine methyltransferase
VSAGTPPTVRELLDAGAHALAAHADAGEAARDAQVLLGHALGVSRAWLRAHDGDRPEGDRVLHYEQLLAARATGRPVAQLLGAREFYGRSFRITPDVLIPRPETETLVEAALKILPPGRPHAVLDLGTGSGCIAVTLALERPVTGVTAVERSPAALEVARANALQLGARVEFLAGNWFGPVAGRRFDLVVANPPYVAADDPHLQRGDVRFEPAEALAAGDDGLRDLRRIIDDAPANLCEGGWLLVEHGHDQGEACRDLLVGAGFGELLQLADLAGISRVAGGQLVRHGVNR